MLEMGGRRVKGKFKFGATKQARLGRRDILLPRSLPAMWWCEVAVIYSDIYSVISDVPTSFHRVITIILNEEHRCYVTYKYFSSSLFSICGLWSGWLPFMKLPSNIRRDVNWYKLLVIMIQLQTLEPTPEFKAISKQQFVYYYFWSSFECA